MSQYISSVIRFLAHPDTGEFINVGVIAGDPQSQYWVTRGGQVEARVLALTNSVKDLQDIQDFIIQLQDSAHKQRGMVPVAVGALWLENILAQQVGQKIQLSSLEEVEADSPEAYFEALFQTLVREDDSKPHNKDVADYSYNYNPPSTSFIPFHDGVKKASQIGDYFDDCLGEKNNPHKRNRLRKAFDSGVQALTEIVIASEELLAKGADILLHKLRESNEKRRMLNPIYKEIEERRHQSGDGLVTFFDESKKLGPKELILQDGIAQLIDQNPWWAKVARFLRRDNLVSGLFDKATYRGQMLSRGWADADVWSLNAILCQRLGSQLLTLAHKAYSTPAFGVYLGSDQWVEDLHKYGYALRVYGEFNASEEVDNNYFADIDKNIAKDERGYWEQHLDREEYAQKKAQEALHWVATYLPHISG